MPHKKKRNTKKKKKNNYKSVSKKSEIVHHKDVIKPNAATIDAKKIVKKENGDCDTSGVKRLFSPFNRFANSNKVDYSRPPKMAYISSNFPNGLSPKEKCYVINSCQTRSTRYTKLKTLAAEAIKRNKIFSIYGSRNAGVRKALLERDWIEKIPPNRMNLCKIRNGTLSDKTEIHSELERLLLSNFVEKYCPNFIWCTRDELRDTTIDMTKECNTIVNKLAVDAMWTSKQGLCSSMKRNYWFYIEDVAEVNGPRSYNTYDVGEIEGFVKDYKITACTSLLKWVLSMVANERPVFVASGNISMDVVVFALNRCKEYLFRKQNKDIDRSLSTASTGQWNSFLKMYYRIIAKDDVFESDTQNKLPLYLSYANFLLKEIHKYRPQLSCEGCHNIWIIKPAHCSRGRGIRMASKLGVITDLLSKVNSKYVIQKYIEEPLLIYDTKFDIRQYYLVTSTYPLIIWMYQDCYLKFSSQRYSLKNYHESIHLTNNAVQRKYNNCQDRHAELPHNNMWDSDKYKNYLNKIGKEKVWNNLIYPGMRKSIIAIMLSCQDSLTACKNRFELYGCDFILDKEYKPWLIEINSCPDLNHTTQVTAKICPAVVSDIIKVVIDYSKNPNAQTGRFECVYRQPMTIPRYGSAGELVVRGYSLPNDYFYKGNIEIKETYDELDIGRENDITGILDKLKELHETATVMIEPEDENVAPAKEQQTCTHQTESELELSVAAEVITEQLDQLLDNITSVDSLSMTDQKEYAPSTQSSKESLNQVHVVKSVTDIKSLMKHSVSRVASMEIMNGKQSFKFSKLDDGSQGKASCYELVPIDNNMLSSVSNVPYTARRDPPISKNITKHPQDRLMKATTKLISFISEKEKEYKKILRIK